MNNVFEQFFTMPMAIFCVAIWFIVFVQRKVMETVKPSIKDNKYWRELFLPLGPAGTGAILAALISKFPFPEMLTSLSGRVFAGIVCGLCSGLAYRMLKQFFAVKTGTSADAVNPTDPS